jgi:hypothetical protein
MPVDFEIRFRRNHARVLMRGYNSLKLSGKGMSADSFNLMFFGIHCLLICRLSEHCEAFFSNIPLATIAYTLTRASKPTPPWIETPADFEFITKLSSALVRSAQQEPPIPPGKCQHCGSGGYTLGNHDKGREHG